MIDWFGLAMAGIDLVKGLIDRANQSGELTPAQSQALDDRAASIFLKHSGPVPPPPGG